MSLKLHFVNVGNGDSILLEYRECEEEFTLLIDGGSKIEEEYHPVQNTGRIKTIDFLKKMGISHLDAVVCTHIHEDHVGGLPAVIEAYRPKKIWQPYPVSLIESLHPIPVNPENSMLFSMALNSFCELQEKAAAYGGKVLKTGIHEWLTGAEYSGFSIRVIGPKPETLAECTPWLTRLAAEKAADYEALAWMDRAVNNTSLVLEVSYAGRAILLPGDMQAAGYDRTLLPEKTDILKPGHHGQENGLDPELLDLLRPEYAVITASSDRRYNSAHPNILKLLHKRSIHTFFTDCPEVPPFTDGLTPHSGVTFEITEDGEIHAGYLPVLSGI